METKEKKMKPLNTFGVQFLIRQDKLKDGKAPIYARITANGEIVHFALKQWIDPKYWDLRKGYGKGNKSDISKINNDLEELRLALGNHHRQLQLKGQLVTANAVKDAYLGNDDDEPNTLSRLIEYHFETAKAVLEWSTLKHYKVTERYLERFLEAKHKKNDVFLHEVNYKFIVDFETFLRRHKPADHQKAMNNNGVMKHLLRLRKMTTLAIKLEWINNDPFKNYKFKFERIEKDFLNEYELGALEKKKFELERLTIVKDVFLFCCYTGLAYVDVLNLQTENIVIGIDGEDWIKTCRQKTKIAVNTPLLPKAKRLIVKYLNHFRDKKPGHVFPVFSNQKVNSYLKEIADGCGIRKNLTSHVARHTFATTVTLSNGVPIETVSKMLGHTKIATTQIYARVLEKKIGEDMLLLRKKLGR
ncbi:MAG TPA: site-specific integrase [Mucilaginibacter sp.]|jgi:site-specific recombinase XerD|nr:site-specific integrase [Mucilaginibacter sp.]